MSTDTTIAPDPNASAPADPIQAIVERTKTLYSMPAVAMEVVRLTSNPQIDTRALKECIEQDPALTIKLLKVVNSSLFGLSREVRDLNQALALLGTKPLKLLVLGFSLPEKLFTDLAKEQLTWYWRSSLVRAVAARELSQRYWNNDGDEAFLAGLLQDIGVLVLMNQLGKPYVDFLSRAIEEHSSLGPLEVESMGFDHRTLTASLLKNWNMPPELVEAISTDTRTLRNSTRRDTTKVLAKTVHLASLLAELVGHNRILALPELLEAGKAYCGLDKNGLHEMLPPLQERVNQLADVLSLDLGEEVNYAEIVIEAHQQIAILSESVSEQLSTPQAIQQDAAQRMLDEARQLQQTVRQFVSQPVSNSDPGDGDNSAVVPGLAANATTTESSATDSPSGSPSSDFVRRLTLAVGASRSKRSPISVMQVSIGFEPNQDPQLESVLAQIVGRECRKLGHERMERLGTCQWVVLLPDCERHQAVRQANHLIESSEAELLRAGDAAGLLYSISIGVASVTLPPRNFNPPDLLTSAERCHSAAQTSDANVVKSIEVL